MIETFRGITFPGNKERLQREQVALFRGNIERILGDREEIQEVRHTLLPDLEAAKKWPQYHAYQALLPSMRIILGKSSDAQLYYVRLWRQDTGFSLQLSGNSHPQFLTIGEQVPTPDFKDETERRIAMLRFGNEFLEKVFPPESSSITS